MSIQRTGAVPGNTDAQQMLVLASQKLSEAREKAGKAPTEMKSTAQQNLFTAQTIYTIAQQRAVSSPGDSDHSSNKLDIKA